MKSLIDGWKPLEGYGPSDTSYNPDDDPLYDHVEADAFDNWNSLERLDFQKLIENTGLGHIRTRRSLKG